MNDTTPTAPDFDITCAESNWIQFGTDWRLQAWAGPLARKLMDSQDFEITPFTYSVWEVTGDCHPLYRNPDATSFACILRANQSTLAGALRYMTKDRVLVWNKGVSEAESEP